MLIGVSFPAVRTNTAVSTLVTTTAESTLASLWSQIACLAILQIISTLVPTQVAPLTRRTFDPGAALRFLALVILALMAFIFVEAQGILLCAVRWAEAIFSDAARVGTFVVRYAAVIGGTLVIKATGLACPTLGPAFTILTVLRAFA